MKKQIENNPKIRNLLLRSSSIKRGNALNLRKASALFIIMLFVASIPFTLTPITIAQETKPCESCGMSVDATGQNRCRIVDVNSTTHVACCPVCALKLLKTYGALNYTHACDYNGPSNTISIIAKNYGADVTVTPSTALIILGGGCAKNRLVADSASADAILAPPNNGTSKWLPTANNVTVAANATRLGVVQAALQYGGGPTASPTPTATPLPTPTPTSATPTTSSNPTTNPTANPTTSPTPTPNPTSTQPPTAGQTLNPQLANQECEACGMVVIADDQWHFKVTDGSGNNIYVECIMCALNLIKRYDTLHIETFCDYYGPDHPITIDSTGKGAQVTVNPITAMYLYTGSCENNRIAYDRAAADYLETGYTQYTSKFQQHYWQMQPSVVTVVEGVDLYNEMTVQEADKSLIIILLGVVIAVIAVAIAVLAYTRLKRKPTN